MTEREQQIRKRLDAVRTDDDIRWSYIEDVEWLLSEVQLIRSQFLELAREKDLLQRRLECTEGKVS